MAIVEEAEAAAQSLLAHLAHARAEVEVTIWVPATA